MTNTVKYLIICLLAVVFHTQYSNGIPPSNPFVTLIDQTKIPYTITVSGRYRLEGNVQYTGSGNAITIQANEVKLELRNSSIFLTNSNATAIFAQNVSELTIETDEINNTNGTQNGYGIHLINVQKTVLSNIFTINNSHGLFIENSSDVLVQNSEFFSATQSGAFVSSSTNVTFDNCVFSASNNGLTFTGANQDCRVTNCQFPSAIFANLLVQQITGLLVQNCSFGNQVGSDPGKLALVQFGDADPTQVCNDVVFQNCTIVNQGALSGNTAPEGLGIYQGSGFLVNSCVIDIDNTLQDPAVDLSGIHVSNPGLGISGTIASNVIIRNCVVQGPATNGFYPDVGSSGVIIENCLANGAQKNGIFLAGTSSSTVQNNTVVNNGTNGIFLGETSSANAINNNVVNSNGFNIIGSSLPPQGNGIGIASDSDQNTVQNNEIYLNGAFGINDAGLDNAIFYNSAYANGSGNYFASSDTIVTNIPGSPTVAGENLDI